MEYTTGIKFCARQTFESLMHGHGFSARYNHLFHDDHDAVRSKHWVNHRSNQMQILDCSPLSGAFLAIDT